MLVQTHPMRPTNYFLDSVIAPDLSAFRGASLPSLVDEFTLSKHWLAHFFLNRTLRSTSGRGVNAVECIVLKKAVAAFRAYDSARDALAKYEAGTEFSLSLYFECLEYIEAALAACYQAFEVVFKLDKSVKPFNRGDGSELQRLNVIYNASKHFDAHTASLPAPATLAVWLTTHGVACTDGALSFAEVVAVLRDLGTLANRLSSA